MDVNSASLQSLLKTHFWRKAKHTIFHLEGNAFHKKYEMEIWAYNGVAPSACVSGSCNVIHISRGHGTPTGQIF